MYISLLLKTFVSPEQHVGKNAPKVGATKDEELFKYSSHQITRIPKPELKEFEVGSLTIHHHLG